MIHPSPLGEAKVGSMLSAFFHTSVTAQAWFPARAGTALISIDAAADATVNAGNPDANFGFSPQLHAGIEPAERRSFLRFNTTDVRSTFTHAKLSLRSLSNIFSTSVWSVTDTSWQEAGITWNNAPAIDGGLIQTMPFTSGDGTIGAEVSAVLERASSDGVSFALTNIGELDRLASRESGEPPRLIITVISPCARADLNVDEAVDVTDLLLLLSEWAETDSPADLNDDGIVDVGDLLMLLSHWGTCG